jgi:enoyl-CoA hydratase/carnithine racemase
VSEAGPPYGRSVRYEVRGLVAIVTLSRPEAMNSINAAMREELPAAIAEAERDESVRVIVLRGMGERAFCAGADIKEFTAPRSLVGVRDGRRAPTWIDVLAAAAKPVIAAIHGYCYGGGVEIALACDIRVAATDAQFAFPEVKLGIIPGAGGTQRLSRAIGTGPALRLILSGERIDAARALSVGLVTDVYPVAEMFDSVMDMATAIAANAPIAVRFAKEAVRRGIELPIGEGLALETDLAVLLQSTQDRLEGAAAFRERRPPCYQGR